MLPLLLVACAPQSANDESEAADAIGGLSGMIRDRDQEIARLKARIIELEKAPGALPAARSKVGPEPKVGALDVFPAEAEMCLEDYCPCDEPQEGMEMTLCDQLKAGVDVPIETMIAGKGMKEARRQIAESGF